MKARKQYYQIARQCAEQRDNGCNGLNCMQCPYNLYGYFPKKPRKALRHLATAYSDHQEAKEAAYWSRMGTTIWAGLQLAGLIWLVSTIWSCFK